MPFRSLLGWARAACLVAIACAACRSTARAQAAGEATACPVWDQFVKARESADATAKALHTITLPRELEEKITLKLARVLVENPGINFKAAYDLVKPDLSATEQLQLAPWYAARAARDAADAALKRASDAYTAAVNAKDAALAAAEKAFEAEQAWLQAEKEAIRSMPRDDAYLERVSRITARLKAAYLRMRTDLAPHRDCFSDVRSFLDDKDERLAKIATLDAEIARRRGLPATQPATQPAGDNTAAVVPGEPPPPGALGDVYVCDGPEVKQVGPGKFTRVDAKGFAYEREVDGQRYTGSVTISKPPPLRVRANERVEIVMSASGDVRAAVDANWECNNVIAGQLPSDNACSNIPKYKGVGDSSTATVRFYFGLGPNAYIRMYGGEYDSRDGTRMDIVWRYRKLDGQ